MFKNIEKGKVLELACEVNYQVGQIVSKTLVQNSLLSITLFAFDKGEEISTHTSNGDAMVTVLDGLGKLTVGADTFLLEAGQTLIMPKDIPHSVFAEDRLKMILIVSF